MLMILHILLHLILGSLVICAQRNQITSTSVASCGQNGINVQSFGFTYYRWSRVLEYEFVGYATTADTFSEILVDVTAYGRNIPTQTIELCGFINCPISGSTVQGNGSQVLSESYANSLPSIVWTIPDLDAIVTLKFRNVTDLACLMASISNGVTTQTTSVPWTTGGITMGIIIVSGMISAAGTLGSATNATAKSAASPALAPGSSSAPAPAPEVHPTSPWAGSNFPAPTSPASVHSSLPPGAGEPAYPGGGEAFALGAAGIILGAGGATMTTNAAANHGSNIAQHQGHTETTAPISSHSLFARMDPIVLFLHFQSISSSGLLSLRYPTIYQAFTVNFAWANFILPIGVFKRAVSHFRKCTLPDTQFSSSGSGVSSLTVPSVSYGPPLANQTGIDAYATRLKIPSQDIFGIVYLVFLSACAALLLFFLVVGFALQITVWVSSPQDRKDIWRARRFRWAEMASNNSLRIMVLALGTLATFAFYQWTQHCATGLAFFLSASALAIILLNLGVVCFLILHIGNRPGGTALLFSDKKSYGRRWGTLYDSLNETRLFFVVPLLIVSLARSAVIGFGQGHGFAQAIALIAIEAITAVSLFYWHPYYSKGYNLVNYLQQTMRVISHALLIFFVPSFNFNVIGTTVIGIVLLVLHSITALVLVALTVLKMGWGVLWYRSKHHGFESRKDRYKRQSGVEVDQFRQSEKDDEDASGTFSSRVQY